MSGFPYTLQTGDELRAAMNKFSDQGKAFFVLISYDTTSGYCIPIDEIDERWIRFQFDRGARWRNEAGFCGMSDDSHVQPKPFHSGPSISENNDSSTSFVNDWKVLPVSIDEYRQRFDKVKQHLKRGNTFLVNLTQPSRVQTSATLAELYVRARAPYKVWLRDQLVCFSPECFVTIADGEIRTFPMKGTLDASLPDARNQLLENEKEKAEHATIVDLLRNDLSMVASGVEVTRYRYVDRIKTHRGDLLQVSSELCGRLPDDYRSRLGDIVFAMLPAGSICGAPKARTLEVIREAEGYKRGFYTGIGGYFDGDTFDSAVLIRYMEQTTDGYVFKSGGGITFRSDMEKEYQELIQKVYVPVE